MADGNLGAPYRIHAKDDTVDLAVLCISAPATALSSSLVHSTIHSSTSPSFTSPSGTKLTVEFGVLRGFGRLYLVGSNADVSYEHATAYYQADSVPSRTEFLEKKEQVVPRRLSVNVGAGRIDARSKSLLYDISSLGGMSGAGVFDGKLRLIGTYWCMLP
jgi:hypothetical protein